MNNNKRIEILRVAKIRLDFLIRNVYLPHNDTFGI